MFYHVFDIYECIYAYHISSTERVLGSMRTEKTDYFAKRYVSFAIFILFIIDAILWPTNVLNARTQQINESMTQAL